MKYPVYAFDKTSWLVINPKTKRCFYTLHTIEDVIYWINITDPEIGHHIRDIKHLTFLFEIDPDDYSEYRI